MRVITCVRSHWSNALSKLFLVFTNWIGAPSATSTNRFISSSTPETPHQLLPPYQARWGSPEERRACSLNREGLPGRLPTQSPVGCGETVSLKRKPRGATCVVHCPACKSRRAAERAAACTVPCAGCGETVSLKREPQGATCVVHCPACNSRRAAERAAACTVPCAREGCTGTRVLKRPPRGAARDSYCRECESRRAAEVDAPCVCCDRPGLVLSSKLVREFDQLTGDQSGRATSPGVPRTTIADVATAVITSRHHHRRLRRTITSCSSY
jgi:ribosomal protein S27E